MSYLFTPQCIICEGEQDRVVLAELAARVLRTNSISRRLDIVVANGKVVIPRVVQAVEPQFPPDSVIVVADSDGRADATRRMLERSLGGYDHWLVIANPNVESWVAGRGRKFYLEDLRDAAAQANLQVVETRHPEFRLFREALISIPLPQ